MPCSKAHFWRRILPLFILSLLLILSRPVTARDEAKKGQDVIAATARDLALAMGVNSNQIVSATTYNSDQLGFGISTAPLGTYFPTQGSSFAILSTGHAADAVLPNNDGKLSSQLSGMLNMGGWDLVQLDLSVRVPRFMNCLTFDFAFYSEEVPEYLGEFAGQFNDTFTAEFGGSQMDLIIEKDTAGGVISARIVSPLNFAYDDDGEIMSVNTSFGVTSNTGTTYDGVTPLLRAYQPVRPNSIARVVFTVQDLGDRIYDSAVFMDNLRFSNDPDCGQGVQADTDRDGLYDAWERDGLTTRVNGKDVFLNLPAMGADPKHKDVFVEIDYMVDTGLCIPSEERCRYGVSHLPKDEAIDKIVRSFAAAPNVNPDGSTGITLHVDYGPDSIMNPKNGATWGALSRSNPLGYQAELGESQGNIYSFAAFDRVKAVNFPKERAPVFHYAVFGHQLGGLPGTGGVARAPVDGEPGSSDMLVTLGGWGGGGRPQSELDEFGIGTINQQAGTLMHLLGHNLGISEGADHSQPNYLSVMNPLFETRGLTRRRLVGSDFVWAPGFFDFSDLLVQMLDEANLDEAVGLQGDALLSGLGTRYFCPNGAPRDVMPANGSIDWDCNGAAGGTTQADVNHDGALSSLYSYFDWERLTFTGGPIGPPSPWDSLPPSMEVKELTRAQDTAILSPYEVSIIGPGSTATLPGETVSYTFTVTNHGTQAETYQLVADTNSAWADLSGAPASMNLAAGESRNFSISVTVPLSAGSGNSNVVGISVWRGNDNPADPAYAPPRVSDYIRTTTRVVYQSYLPMIAP